MAVSDVERPCIVFCLLSKITAGHKYIPCDPNVGNGRSVSKRSLDISHVNPDHRIRLHRPAVKSAKQGILFFRVLKSPLFSSVPQKPRLPIMSGNLFLLSGFELILQNVGRIK
jgi:hypothetical protein